jgi:hypothetical protein
MKPWPLPLPHYRRSWVEEQGGLPAPSSPNGSGAAGDTRNYTILLLRCSTPSDPGDCADARLDRTATVDAEVSRANCVSRHVCVNAMCGVGCGVGVRVPAEALPPGPSPTLPPKRFANLSPDMRPKQHSKPKGPK